VPVRLTYIFFAGFIDGHRFGSDFGKHDVANVLERLRVNDIEGVSFAPGSSLRFRHSSIDLQD